MKCLRLTARLVECCGEYDWECSNCKLCEVCRNSEREADVLLCDRCDRGYHTFCLKPPLKRKPPGEWLCPRCIDLAFTQATTSAEADEHIESEATTSKGGSLARRKSSVKAQPKCKVTTPPRKKALRQSPKGSVKRTPVSELKARTSISEFCPTPGCTGTGHLGGALDSHKDRDSCPLFHNLSAQECEELYAQRENVKKEAFEQRSLRLMGPTSQQLDNTVSLHKEREQRNADLKSRRALRSELQRKHRDQHGKNREPLLDGLSSDKDLELFRQAQSLLAEDMERDTTGRLKNEKDSRVRMIQMGRFEMETWYSSPFPDGLDRLHALYICQFCLSYMPSATVLQSHMAKCVYYHPPGDEIYRKDGLSVWEVNGKLAKIYSQNLCLLAKLFLDHKTVYFDVEPFLFYVMTVADGEGCHMVGYFSKEKKSLMNCNVSCILTLPPYQRKGFGKLLIEFSYLLSKRENKIGSPERPLSDLGLMTYRNYWKDAILQEIINVQDSCVSIKDITLATAIHSNDIISTLQFLGLVKYWKGEYWIHKRPDIINRFMAKHKLHGNPLTIHPEALDWKPHPDTIDG